MGNSRSTIPEITILCTDEAYEKAFSSAAAAHSLPSSLLISFLIENFKYLPDGTTFDTIVSPANSYGLMDGGFDHYLSKAFSPAADYLALTRVAKAALYREYRGYAPPSTCLLVKLAGEASLKENDWGCKYMAVVPTMRVPQDVNWDRDVVYESTWALLAAVDRHNRRVGEEEGGEGERIEKVMMTPFATGCGMIGEEKWAAQTVLAFKHFVRAVEGEGEWVGMNWPQVRVLNDEIKQTYEL